MSAAPIPADTLAVDPAYGARVGQAYESLPSFDPSALPAYDAFARETRAQCHYLRHALGVRVIVDDDDPYPDAASMMLDAHAGTLRVLATSTTGSHPYLSDADNDAFRAVHDFFGHYRARASFSRHGEESAYRAHSVMYSPLARLAMATETRGQNSSFIFVHGGNVFPEQRIAILPAWARATYLRKVL